MYNLYLEFQCQHLLMKNKYYKVIIVILTLKIKRKVKTIVELIRTISQQLFSMLFISLFQLISLGNIEIEI